MSIEPCPKCKATKGWEWIWGKNDGHSTGYSKCKGCGAKFWFVMMGYGFGSQIGFSIIVKLVSVSYSDPSYF